MQVFSTWLAGEKQRTKKQRRRSAYVFTFADVRKEVAAAAYAAGVTPEQLSTWSMSTWASPTIGAPGISLFRSVMVDKLLAGDRWEANDLTDLMYLCTAAAYADHVVGERRTISLLRQSVTRAAAPVQLHTDLVSLIEALRIRGG